MTEQPTWNLRQDFWVSVLESGTKRLFWDDRALHVFLAGTLPERIEAFAEGYELGRAHGSASGECVGRHALAADLRRLLQIP